MADLGPERRRIKLMEKYHIALSFAGEDREYVDKVAHQLQEKGVKVFYDKFEEFRCKEIKILLFDEYLRETNNEKAGNQSISKFFK